MARVKKAKQDEGVQTDMTPLIDCIFLLLIFLMCVTEITKTENDQALVLPYAKLAVKDENPEDRIVLNVWPVGHLAAKTWGFPETSNSWVTISGKPMDWGGLMEFLERRARTAPKIPGPAGSDLIELPVKIRGHRTSPFKVIQFAMIYCIDMRYYKISFGTYNEIDFKAPNQMFGDTPNNTIQWQPSEMMRRIFK